MLATLQNPVFQDETKAREWFEARVWPNGPVCPHCGCMERITKLEGEAHRPGVYQCNEPECRSQFTVTVNTVFERSKIPLTKWLAALFLMVSSKKGVSAHQVHRMLNISYKSTWFMMHRLREAMRLGDLAVPQMGGGGVVEIDETIIGKNSMAPKNSRKKPGSPYRNVVMTLVERGGGARSFHLNMQDAAEIVPIIRENIKREATINTDQANWYKWTAKEFAAHHAVDHSKDEYVRREKHMIDDETVGERLVTTNTVEGYFSVFKRGMKGVYQHCSEKHLHRYLAEFDFRYSNRAALGVDDVTRAERLAAGIRGKRLTYRRPNSPDIPF